MKFEAWNNFVSGDWQEHINVRDFINKNYTAYTGDASFLAGATDRTVALNTRLKEFQAIERERGGVLSIDTSTVSSLCNYAAGYIDKDKEIIVGLQTDEPLKRGVNPFGGIRMARNACESYGYKLSDKIEEYFTYRTTHNDGVFRVYTDEMKAARHCGLLTGLPDAYGRGRIIGDYRRIALYGVDCLIEQKVADKKAVGERIMDSETIKLLEELYSQIDFLKKLKKMAGLYGIDISLPATNAREAVQWTYFGYLAANKEQNGAAMSFGRCSTFFDIYIERDMKAGILDEVGAQEIIDDLVIKLRAARHLRPPEYNELFGGDPMWITESVGGMGENHRTLVTKSSFRILNTLYTLGEAPEPNLTVLWSNQLPAGFKRFCAKLSVDTDSIQYENDDLMRISYGDDYAIACCVSAMKVGKQMQFFGARTNLAKLLLLALNGGIDNMYGTRLGPEEEPMSDEVLDYTKVKARFDRYLSWLCRLYVNTMNCIHYMHDKYAYEKTQMALHDTDVDRLMAFGVAGLSVITDSLSAIKYAEVRPVRDEKGIIVDFITTGDFPKFGNDDDRVDEIAQDLLRDVIAELKKTPAYRGAEHTL
ncbi:MAG: formate acetyltransferase, partial [Clostridia bacterium]|nr:formate acetyltransferase [Clostridia bacterium]